MPVVVMCTVCKQRSKVMEDMVGKPVKCPGCGKDFVARPEGSGTPAVKKTGVKTADAKPTRVSTSGDGWADLQESSPRRQSAGSQGGGLMRILWLVLAFLAGAGAGGTGVYIALRNDANNDLAQIPGPLKKGDEFSKKEPDKKTEAKKEFADPKKDEKKGDAKKDEPKIVDNNAAAFLKVQKDSVLTAGFSKDGKEILVCSRDGMLTWYDADSLTVKRSLPLPAHKKGLDGIDIDQDGKSLLAISFGTLIETVDSASGERNPLESKIRGNLRETLISGDGKIGITALDTLLYVWDLSERKLLKRFNPHQNQGLPVAIALSGDGKLLASSGQVDDAVLLFDTSTWKELGALVRVGGARKRGTELSSSRPAFSPDSKYLAFPSVDQTLIIYHVPTKKQRLALEVESKSLVRAVGFSSDGHTVAAAVGDGTVHLWDVRTGERRAILSMNSKGKGELIDRVQFNPEGSKLLANNRLEQKVFVWDLNKVKLEPVDLAKTIKDPELTGTGGDEALTFLKDKNQIMNAAFSKDAKEILICTRQGDLKWYDASTMTEKRTLPKPEKYSGVNSVSIDPEGKTALVISFESLVEAVAGETGERAGLPSKQRFPLPLSAISGDGTTGAAFLGKVVVWDVANRKLFKEHASLGGAFKTMALSADGSMLATGDLATDSYRVWDPTNGKELAVLVPQAGRKDRFSVFPGRPAFSPDGKYLAGTTMGNQLVIYHLPSKKQRLALPIETKSTAMWSAAFSNDGNTVAQGVLDGTIHLFDVRTGERRAILSMGDKSRTHFMDGLQFSFDDSKLLASDRNENKVFVWDLGKVKLEPVDLAKTVKDPVVAFNPKDTKGKKFPKGIKDVLKVAGRIDAYLGIVMDMEAGSLLATLPGGLLKQFSYPEFKVQGVYKLAGTGYRPVLDSKRGLLYALVANPKAKPTPPVKKRGGNEIHVYDVKNVLDGKIATGNSIRPAKVIPLDAFVTQLLLSPDGASLHVLDNIDPKGAKLVRLDAEKGERISELALAENTDCLCLTRDGKKILAGSHVGARSSSKPRPHQGSIQVIDGEAMKLDKAITVPLDPFYLDAGEGGLVFASGGSGLKTEIVIVDISMPEPVAIWKGAAPGSWIRLSDDRKRLFVSNWGSKLALVSGLILPEKIAGSDLPSGNTLQLPAIGSRGELTITPDGLFLISEAGVIFQLKE